MGGKPAGVAQVIPCRVAGGGARNDIVSSPAAKKKNGPQTRQAAGFLSTEGEKEWKSTLGMTPATPAGQRTLVLRKKRSTEHKSASGKGRKKSTTPPTASTAEEYPRSFKSTASKKGEKMFARGNGQDRENAQPRLKSLGNILVLIQAAKAKVIPCGGVGARREERGGIRNSRTFRTGFEENPSSAAFGHI